MFHKVELKYDKRDNFSKAGADYFSFSFGCAKEPQDGTVGLVNGTHTCREGLMTNMRNRIMNYNGVQPTDKTRMVFFWKASKSNNTKDLEMIDGWIKRAVPVIQAFDKLAGWPITRVHKVDCGQDYIKAFYFRSSRRWMKASYLISLYVLLVRMCKDPRISGFKDFNGLIELIDELMLSHSNNTLLSDHSYVKSSYPYWEAIMRGYPRLFRDKKITYYWDRNRLRGGSSGGYEGIQYLVKGDTTYKEIRDELFIINDELKAKTFKPTTKKKEA